MKPEPINSFPEMSLAAALEFANSGKSKGGITTHAALKTLADEVKRLRHELENATGAIDDAIGDPMTDKAHQTWGDEPTA